LMLLKPNDPVAVGSTDPPRPDLELEGALCPA
jgi:hypothetical protein